MKPEQYFKRIAIASQHSSMAITGNHNMPTSRQLRSKVAAATGIFVGQ